MALTKARTSIYASEALTDGGGPTSSAWQTTTDSYQTTVNVKITNGTSLTVGATFKIEVAGESTPSIAYDATPTYQHSVVDSDVKSWSIELPMGTMYFRVTFTHATGDDVDVDVEYVEVTAI